MKKNIIFFLLGIIIASFSTYALFSIKAKQVTYNDSTVDIVLNDLYDKIDDKIILNTFGTIIINESMGDASTDKTTSLTLNKGKYLINVIQGNGYFAGNNNKTSGESEIATIVCESNCSNITRLNGRLMTSSATSANNGSYSKAQLFTAIYYLEILEDNTVVSSTYTYTGTVSKKQVASHVLLTAIPIN